MRSATHTTETERLPKNFPGLQERMETVKRSNYEKKQITSHSPLENTTAVEKEDTFFLL